MMKSPCKDCKRRFGACHTICPEYAVYRAKMDAHNEMVKANRDIAFDLIGQKMDTHYSIQRAKRRRG